MIFLVPDGRFSLAGSAISQQSTGRVHSSISSHTFFSCAQLVSVCCPGRRRQQDTHFASCLAQDEALCIVHCPKVFATKSRHVIHDTFDVQHTSPWHFHSFLSHDTTYLNFPCADPRHPQPLQDAGCGQPLPQLYASFAQAVACKLICSALLCPRRVKWFRSV